MSAGPGKRREARHETLPYRAVVITRSLAYPVNCLLRNRSTGGALLEFEPLHREDPLLTLQHKTFIWIYICAEETWQEAMIRWRHQRQFGVSFMGEPRRTFMDAAHVDKALTDRHRQAMAMLGRRADSNRNR